MRARSYLDWNATAPLAAAAEIAMRDALQRTARSGLNPSSQHQEGRAARALIETARRQVADLAGAAPSEIVFTSGATEAANWVFAQDWDAIIVSAIEHDCVLGASAAAEARGAARRFAPVDGDGRVDVDALARLLDATEGDRRLVAVMAANNETGALQPVAEIAEIARRAGAALLIDAAQALGKTDFDFGALGADYALLSSHKIGGPGGAGALIIREGLDPAPLLAGGGQESRRRSGTENLLGAVGFGAAAAAIDRSAWAALAQRRDRLEKRLNSEAMHLVFFSAGINRLPSTCCIAARGWRAETQLMQLDLAGFAISAGSACSSGKLAASHVLRAMGAEEALAASAVRISFGPTTPERDLEDFANAYLALLARKRNPALTE